MAARKKILIADDSKVFRTLEDALLKQRGYEVLQACDGAEALRLAIEEKPHLILLDVQMPLLDGVQALTALKAKPETCDIPVVIITTIGREKDRDIMLQGGADAFISKPINGPELMRQVHGLIGGPEAPGA